MDVSIIIVNYNTYNLVIDCIESIIAKTRQVEYEIIVVDNNSPNRDIEKLNDNFPTVKLILNNENLGFGTANNIGSRKAKGKYLFLLNSDAYLIDNTIYSFFVYMESELKCPSIIACGASLLNSEFDETVSAGNFPSLFQEFSDLGFRHFYKNYYNKNLSLAFSAEGKSQLFEVDYICGANIFINKDVFLDFKGFDEDFFMYFEETDLFFRLNKEGFKSVILPKLNIVHLEGGSTKNEKVKLNLRKFKMLFESKCLFYKKNKTKCETFLMKFLNFIVVLIHPYYKGNRKKVIKIVK